MRKQDKAKQKAGQDKAQRYIAAADSVLTPLSNLANTMHPEKVISTLLVLQ